MDSHHPSRLPASSCRLTLRQAMIGALIAPVLLVGCGADGDDSATLPSQTTEPTSDATTESDDGDPDDVLVYGDPDDEEGFAAVVDNDVAPESTLPPDPESAPPDEVIAEVEEQLADSDAEIGGDGAEVLDAIEPLDTADDVATEADGVSRNSSGEPAVLDDEASLACANIEIALGHVDAGNSSVANERIGTAARHASLSDLESIQEWVEPLGTVIVNGDVADLAPLIGFLSACTERGYEL